jgi:hypothetical protein
MSSCLYEFLDVHGLVFEISILHWQDRPDSTPSRRAEHTSVQHVLRTRLRELPVTAAVRAKHRFVKPVAKGKR